MFFFRKKGKRKSDVCVLMLEGEVAVRKGTGWGDLAERTAVLGPTGGQRL